MVCMNNLKQVGLAVMMYADDYNGWAPAGDDASGKKWSHGLHRYVGNFATVGKPHIFVCPSFPTAQCMGGWYTERDTYGWNVGYAEDPSASSGSHYRITHIPVKIASGHTTTDGPSTFLLLADSLYHPDVPRQAFKCNESDPYTAALGEAILFTAVTGRLLIVFLPMVM